MCTNTKEPFNYKNMLNKLSMLENKWCRRRDSNSYRLSPATPSRWCVYQFHHFGTRVELFNRSFAIMQPKTYLAGVAGTTGVGAAGAAGADFWVCLPDIIEEAGIWPEKYARLREVSIKIMAAAVVNLVIKFPPPPAPKTD